jgi:transcriptional regulator with GAF, ATPase, and Fis domain
MTDKDVVERAALLMNGKVATRINLRNILWKQTYRVIIKGSRAVGLMRILYPEMGSRRRSQIDAALETYIERKRGDNTRRLSEDQVRQILKQSGSNTSSLAREFGVSRFTIRSIRERKSWLHIR